MVVLASEYRDIVCFLPFSETTSHANTQFRSPMLRQYLLRIHSEFFFGCRLFAHRINRQKISESMRENACLATVGRCYCAQPRRTGFSSRIRLSCFIPRLP